MRSPNRDVYHMQRVAVRRVAILEDAWLIGSAGPAATS
jgi:hypothetical protein